MLISLTSLVCTKKKFKIKGLVELQDHSKKKIGKAFFHDRAEGRHGSSLTFTSLANKNVTFVTECL